MGGSVRHIGPAVVLAALLVGCPVWAADGRSAAQASWSVMSGRVTMVDPATNTLKVQSGLLQKTFVVDTSTNISDGTRALVLVDLAPGSAVEVEYQNQDGQLLSRSITLGGAEVAMQPSGAMEPSATQPGPVHSGPTPSTP